MNESMREIMLKYLEVTARAAGFCNPDGSCVPKSITEIIGTIISAFLSLLGIIFLILVLYSGFTWMTSLGNEMKVKKAKDTLLQAIIGIIIIISAYAITYFVFSAVGNNLQ
jgi:amino acid transporter